MTDLTVNDFDYDLPEELIAFAPLAQRGQSRLLMLNQQNGDIHHQHFSDLLQFIQPGDLLVLNQSKVMAARLFARRPTGGKVELLIERVIDNYHALVHLKSSKRMNEGATFMFRDGSRADVLTRDNGLVKLKFTQDIWSLMETVGHIPLPPYIKREDQPEDRERYQTVYAKELGSVAAPTAGLHFDNVLLKQLQQKGVQVGFVTLHVGAGTFQPVRTRRIADHHMHSEWINVSKTLCDQIVATKSAGKRVIAVGTTSVRSLETAAQSGRPEAYCGDTRIFIYPGFKFHAVDAMITNFHLPKSSLLMLVSAFSGKDNIEKAYQQAIAERYRFFSYGDAMLLYS